MGSAGAQFFIMDDVECCTGKHFDVSRAEVGGAHAYHHKFCAVLSDHNDSRSLYFLFPGRAQPVYARQTTISGSSDFSAGGLFVHSSDAGWTKPQCFAAELLDGYP